MRRQIAVCACAFMIMTLVACMSNPGEENDQWQRAVLEIYSVSENETIGTVSDANKLK